MAKVLQMFAFEMCLWYFECSASFCKRCEAFCILCVQFTKFILKNNLFLFSLILLCLACTYLNNGWNFVFRALPVSICLFKMNRLMYSPVVSLWIKASAKWINVNVNVIPGFVCKVLKKEATFWKCVKALCEL